MSENKLSQLEQKKRALEIELNRIQSDLDKSIDWVKEDVTNTFSPKGVINKYPLPIVGAAFAIGLLLGKGGKSEGASPTSKRMDSAFGREMKSALTKKGVHLLMDYLDRNVFTLKNKKHDKTS